MAATRAQWLDATTLSSLIAAQYDALRVLPAATLMLSFSAVSYFLHWMLYCREMIPGIGTVRNAVNIVAATTFMQTCIYIY